MGSIFENFVRARQETEEKEKEAKLKKELENDQKSLATGDMSERIWTIGQETDRNPSIGIVEYGRRGTIGLPTERHTMIEESGLDESHNGRFSECEICNRTETGEVHMGRLSQCEYCEHTDEEDFHTGRLSEC